MDQPTGRKILVVEDEAPLRKMLISVLEEAGFTVVEATNGKQGIELAEKEVPDLIVTDNFMPLLNGVDMIAQIRSGSTWGGKVPILLMTNVNNMEAVNKTLASGGVDYLMKSDIQLDAIVALIKQRLGLLA